MRLLAPSSWSTTTLGVVLFTVLFIAYAYNRPLEGWNQNSRLDAVRAIYAGDGFIIDAYHENTGDKSFYDGHWYSDKAPGGILLALPAYGIGRALFGPSGVGTDATAWITTAGSAGLITALGGLALFFFLMGWVGRGSAFLAVLFFFLGSLPFPYATLLFSHGMTAGLIGIALWSCLRTRRHPWQDAFTGCICGWAIITEYPAILAATAVFCITAMRGRRQVAGFILGCIPPLLLLAGYLYVCFGSVLHTTYAHSIYIAPNGLPLFDNFPPSPQRMLYVLLSAGRGLLLWSPILLLAADGMFPLFAKRRALAIITCTTITAYALFAASVNPIDGGYAIGPRHLAPMIPFLALPVALSLGHFRRIGLVLGTLSIALISIATLLQPMAPPSVAAPLGHYYLPLLQEGAWRINWGSLLGLPSAWSFLPFAAIVITALAIGFALPAANTTPKAAQKTR